MRSNGLTAPAYRPVADLDPQVAEAMLGDLASRGVAAYTKPVETPTTVGLDGLEYRVRLKERLFVDTRASADIGQFIARAEPMPDLDEADATWAQIIAGYDHPVDADTAQWPDRENLADEIRASAGRDNPGDVGHAAPAGVDEPFIPPLPPPLPRLDPSQQVAWLGLAGGPLLLLIAALFTVTLPVWLSLAAVIGFVGGFLTLVATMEDRHPQDGDPDDGAVL
jgi:hypothetical protein